MDDEEEDMASQPICFPSFRDFKLDEAVVQHLVAPSTPQRPGDGGLGIRFGSLGCTPRGQSCGFLRGNAGIRSHLPSQREPMEDRGERQIEEKEEEEEAEEEGRDEDDHRIAERPEEQAGMSVEVQIGRKLREIGDKFHHDHIELLLRPRAEHLPVWMRLTMALLGFLFPREAMVPQLRGGER